MSDEVVAIRLISRKRSMKSHTNTSVRLTLGGVKLGQRHKLVRNFSSAFTISNVIDIRGEEGTSHNATGILLQWDNKLFGRIGVALSLFTCSN